MEKLFEDSQMDTETSFTHRSQLTLKCDQQWIQFDMQQKHS